MRGRNGGEGARTTGWRGETEAENEGKKKTIAVVPSFSHGTREERGGSGRTSRVLDQAMLCLPPTDVLRRVADLKADFMLRVGVDMSECQRRACRSGGRWSPMCPTIRERAQFRNANRQAFFVTRDGTYDVTTFWRLINGTSRGTVRLSDC